MKRPSFQFYPSDWRNDAGLTLCSLEARGLWIEMICIMHAAEPYGHLCAAGRPLNARDLARLVGESERDVKRMLEELTRNNVCSVQDGAFFSRRMVRDEALRDARAAGGKAGSEFGYLGAEHGKKGGRPRKETGDKKPPLEPPPSSSSSSSSSKHPQTPTGGFEEFWNGYPKKVGKDAARKAFEKRKPDAELLSQMLAAIAVQAASEQWRKDDGQFIPNPATWLNQARWEDAGVCIGGGTVPGPKPGTDEYAALHKSANWWREAGFPTIWDAMASRCWHDNAHLFRDGKKVQVAA